MPLGYPLYAAAKKNEPSLLESPDVFPILETPRSVCYTWHTPRIDLYFRDTVTMYFCMFFSPPLLKFYPILQQDLSILCLQKKTLP